MRADPQCGSAGQVADLSGLLKILLFVFAALPQPTPAQITQPRTIRVGVFSLFHPQSLTVTQLAPRPSAAMIITRTPADQLDVFAPDGTHRLVSMLELPAGSFNLHVVGRRTTLTRTYYGSLMLTAHDGELRPVITMETEVAVVSVVQAEAPPGAPLEALEAQAVAARSFLLANLHPLAPADTCDTTHCQLLREPPPPASLAARATRATAHLVLTWRPGPAYAPTVVAAQWTPSCAGLTLAGHPRRPADYPFYSVSCAWCRTHPDRWLLPSGTPIPATEQAREIWNREHPANQVRSLHVSSSGAGQGTGHGVGLCQRGASALAAQGETFREILAHYYPNTTLTRVP